MLDSELGMNSQEIFYLLHWRSEGKLCWRGNLTKVQGATRP